jgi:anhydro-N-acetylmuramic acid kinase
VRVRFCIIHFIGLRSRRIAITLFGMAQQTRLPRLIAGAMSGTSADGIDVAIVHIADSGTNMSAALLHHYHLPYDPALRKALFAIRDGGQAIKLSDLAWLGRKISLSYARAINEALGAAKLNAGDLAAVAAHGQTLYHDPPGTIQWLDPSLVAAEVGCAVVSDFRRADCAAGGQGAPLVPFADYILFRDPLKNRVLLNLGGIANITSLSAGAPIDRVIAFDTGPGNCISDHLCRKHRSDGPGFDEGGMLAESGDADRAVCNAFLQNAFIRKRPPKSTDGPQMIAAFEQIAPTSMALNDLLATAVEITVASIVAAIEQLPAKPDQVIASGGGINNRRMMAGLQHMLGNHVELMIADQLGVRSDAKEAMAFALLGAATLDGVPSNVPSVTGARRAVVLGSITPRP